MALPKPRGHWGHFRSNDGPLPPVAGSAQRVPHAVRYDVGLPAGGPRNSPHQARQGHTSYEYPGHLRPPPRNC
eukprot:4932150-Pyramimonas_sp.AAC.1